MAETVTIPREEYELLLECRRVVDADREPSEALLQAIRKSQKDHREGRFRRAKTQHEVRKILRSL